MRRTAIAIFVSVFLAIGASAVFSQQLYTSDKVDYSFELPSPTWRVIEKDTSQGNPELVFGDRLDGYMRLRKEVVESGTTASDLARRDQDQKLRFLPGFAEGKQESFNGRLDGVTLSYEYVNTGKPMLGRIYYLQADPRTIYTLHFTGLKDKLGRIRNQTDGIARSFKIK
ncbi:MAG TPA: hypothetical protein VKB46_15670 [Pyrinomonadaceae bacterium]|nr:hypothetical protein [Pyrinomonadaceae bacterium]